MGMLQGLVLRDDPQTQLHQLIRLWLAWRVHHQIFGALVHREEDHLADVRLFRQQHDDPVDTGRTPTVGRGTVLERVHHAAEPLFDFVLAVACDLERLEHDLWLVVPDGADTSS